MKFLLEVQNLSLSFDKDKSDQKEILKDLNLIVERSSFHSIIGNSGSGKTVFSKTLTGLNPKTANISGEMFWNGEKYDLSQIVELKKLRGKEIAMIFQDPKSSLNPALSVKRHFHLLCKQHHGKKFVDFSSNINDILTELKFENPKEILSLRPHQLSGGMAQRIMIAMVVFLKPTLLIADEPTSNLDVMTAHKVLNLLKELAKSHDITILHISHNLGLCAKFSTHISIMDEKRIIESNNALRILKNPKEILTKEFVNLIQKDFKHGDL